MSTRFHSLTIALTLALAALPAAAVAQPVADEAAAARAVARAVTTYERFTIFDDVTLEIEGRALTLRGKVTMPFKRDEIGKRALAAAPGYAVSNEIEVLPASIHDDALRQKISRAIYGSPAFWRQAAMPNPPIHIIVERGRVTLTGVVSSDGRPGPGAFACHGAWRAVADECPDHRRRSRRREPGPHPAGGRQARLREAAQAGSSCSPVPHRRLVADVPRVPRRSAGLTGPDGQVDQRRVRLRHDAAEAHRRPPARATSPRLRPRRADVPDDLAADYKANRAPMPDDLAEQIPLGARGVRGARRAHPHLTRVRGRRRHRHAGAAGAPPGSTSPSSRATRTSSSSSASVKVYNPRDEGTWYDADGVVEKFGVRPSRSSTCSR
jgi:hyperosmotically inducible periplasmic protein